MYKVFTQTKNSFEGQLPDETTIKVLRQHWFIMFKDIALVVFSLVPIVVVISVGLTTFDYLYANLIWLATTIVLLFWWFWLFYQITMYLLNTVLITDHRIIVSKQLGLFRRSVAELDMRKVQDVSVNVNGMIETMLDFGSIEVQSAAAEKKIHLVNIEKPFKVKDSIMRAFDRYADIHSKDDEHAI